MHPVIAPRYLPSFVVSRSLAGSRYLVRDPATGAALAQARAPRGTTQVAFAGADGPVCSYLARGPGEYDVLDERGEAIGYFRHDHLSGPYLDALVHRGGAGRSRWIELRDEEYLVLRVQNGRGRRDLSVTVPDRRLAFRLALAVVVGLERSPH